MARRIEIELTSARPDGTWTWRAAGAREPKGALDGALLPDGANAGDVLRADADFEVDGISILAVLPPKAKREEPDRLQILGPSRPSSPGVTTQLAGRPDRRGRDGRDRSRDGRDRQRETRDRSRDTRDRARDARDRPRAGTPPDSREREGRRAAPRRDRQAGSDGKADSGRDGSDAPTAGSRREAHRAAPPGSSPRAEGRQGARRLNPANTHRAAVLDSLPPEQRPIAEQVLRGGVPAVRTAIHLEREKASSEGRSAPNADALVAMAEELQPRLKAAEWRDRAEAAAKAGDNVSLRDLRAIVAGADAARGEEPRELAASLRARLDERVTSLRDEWVADVASHLDEGRVVRGLRLAGRPPDPQARVPSDLAARLTDAASSAMAPDTPPERWSALLEAVAASPVRRSVRPAGLPSEASPEVVRAAQQQAGRVPALAPMLGLSIPPPPGPVRPAGPRRAPRRPAPRPPEVRDEPTEPTEPPASPSVPAGEESPSFSP